MISALLADLKFCWTDPLHNPISGHLSFPSLELLKKRKSEEKNLKIIGIGILSPVRGGVSGPFTLSWISDKSENPPEISRGCHFVTNQSTFDPP